MKCVFSKEILFLLAIVSVISLSSCEDKTKPDENEEKKFLTAGNANLAEPEIDAYVAKIDALPEENMPYLSSLHYSNDMEDLQVRAYIQDSSVVKIVEIYNYKPKGIFGRRSYYIGENGLVFVRQIQQEPYQDSSAIMHEIISYYKKGEVIKSANRFADFEEDLVLEQFSKCPNTTMPFDDVNKMMNREGRFTTNFLGFIQSGNFTFLWIGENDKAGLTTTLLIDLQDQFIAALIKNPEKYKGRHIDVNFEHSTMQGITYQMYRGGMFVE